MRERRRIFNREAKIGSILVVVRLPGDFWRDIEILGKRRRGGLPFETSGWPWVGPGNFSVTHRPGQVNHRKQVAQRENGRSSGGHHIEHLIFRRIAGIPARHAEVAENELREEREIESDKERDG